MAEAKKIRTKSKLFKALAISSLEELDGNQEKLSQFVELVPVMTPKLCIEIMRTVTGVAKTVADICRATGRASEKLSEAQRERWMVLGKMIEDGRFSPEIIVEMIELVTETERTESKKLADIVKTGLIAAGVVAIVLLAVFVPSARAGLLKLAKPK